MVLHTGTITLPPQTEGQAGTAPGVPPLNLRCSLAPSPSGARFHGGFFLDHHADQRRIIIA